MFGQSDLDIFFADTGVDVTPAVGVPFRANFDMPSEIIAGGMIISTSYKLLAKSSDVADLVNRSNVTIEGVVYEVREVRGLDDGALSEVFLSKV